ncbi:MAG TPA: hypothetical protein VNH11_03580 [Pirellulales bacterium]|nr:hypothetical protein [Pirellulales bacterium]
MTLPAFNEEGDLLRRLACFDGEQAAVEYWQVKRGGRARGIVEIIEEQS